MRRMGVHYIFKDLVEHYFDADCCCNFVLACSPVAASRIRSGWEGRDGESWMCRGCYLDTSIPSRHGRVVKKSGHYFTLDNTRLYMFQRMEEEGHCKLVPVDIVMLKKVPEAVQNMMVLPPGVEGEHVNSLVSY
ncbi:hypothetical protein PoB_000835500 [Plakobranchus ocellatus]|uniref:Uncharacterized protein n=1 Tax=Plakobranchus ocellatus TaxID=259542 RepID=A0AAV3YH58_9GAST|nr:hypothetical protein PoB_000835500 [Plakobranchus ocellatus]